MEQLIQEYATEKKRADKLLRELEEIRNSFDAVISSKSWKWASVFRKLLSETALDDLSQNEE